MDANSPAFAPHIVILKWDRLYGDMIRRQIWDLWPEASVSVFQTGFEALSFMGRNPPDLLISGTKISDMDGLEHLEPFVDDAFPILVVTSRVDARTFELLREVRCEGLYDGSGEGLDNLSAVLRLVIQRRLYVSPAFRDFLKPQKNITIDVLTAAQQVVLSIIGDGSTDIEGSERLSVAPGTVNQHRKAIMRKLGLHHRGELIRYALQHGYVRVTPTKVYHPGFQRKFQSGERKDAA